MIGATPRPVRDPDHLIVLSTTDVKGKTSPCGCHTPKGGFARRAAFVDSVRAEHDQVVLVDAGGFFPETESQRDAGPFVLQTMKALGTAAANVGDKELAFGSARQIGDVVLIAKPHDGLHVGRVAREADDVGTVLLDRETVALINNHFGVVRQQVVVAQSTSQFGEERRESGCDHGGGIQRAGRRLARRHGA